MKTKLLSLALSLFSVLSAMNVLSAQEADSTGLAGDHFSLEGAIELFRKSESLEDFEKALNSENNFVNNLDLNEDGQIDYIRVIDNMDGDVHAIVLQVPVSETESQDIAVIEIEKTGPEEALLQIIGDEDLYGSAVLVEPFEEEGKKGGKGGPAPVMAPVRLVVNVWGWPTVRWVYRPGYVVYVSPYRYNVYPRWWRPWRPHPWGHFYVSARPYRTHCHVVTTHRVVRAHQVYAPRRTSSTVVRTRTTTTINKRAPQGKTSVTRTTTTTRAQGQNGNVKAQRSTTQTRTQGQNGNAKAQRSTTQTRTQGPNGNVKAQRNTTKTKVQGPKGGSATRKTTTTKVKSRRGG